MRQEQAYLSCLLLSIFVLFSCQDETSPEGEFIKITAAPALQYVSLFEIMKSDREDINRKEEFFYSKGRLNRHVTTQFFVSGTDNISIQNETTLTYRDHEVIVTDAFNNQSVYTLDDRGYAISCLRKETDPGRTREYVFDYSTNTLNGAFLVGITEFINGNVQSKLTFNELTLTKASLSTLVGGIQQNTFRFTLNNNNSARLPWLYMTEIYPLTLHTEALYAGLLGENPMTLLETIRPDGGNEETKYSYRMDEKGYLSSCTERILSKGMSYKRSIEYSIVMAE